MKFSPSSGTKKTVGMILLYVLIPLFVLWYLFIYLKIIHVGLADVILIALLFALVFYYYALYRRKTTSAYAPDEPYAAEGVSEDIAPEDAGQFPEDEPEPESPEAQSGDLETGVSPEETAQTSPAEKRATE